MTTMEKPRKPRLLRAGRLAAVFATLILAAAAPASTAAASTETVLWNFAGGASDGATPYAGLIMDSSGNLYGATDSGGAYGQGVVFRLSPAGSETILWNLPGSGSGAAPIGAPVMDSSGNILGTAAYNSLSSGVGSGDGIVYELTPTGTGSYAESTIHAFSGGADGANSFGGVSLMTDSSGNYYGTTFGGGASSDGTLFKLAPNGSGSYTYSWIYSFTGGNSAGASPYAGPTIDNSNNAFAATPLGGSLLDEGAVVKYVLSSGTPSLPWGFNGSNGNGTAPRGAVILDGSGNIYGTTSLGGSSSDGVVYKLTSNGIGGYTYSNLHVFTGVSPDGANPWSSLFQDSSGNLYGTTVNGGASGHGVVFKLTLSGGAYTYTTLHSFSGGASDGANPYAGLIVDSSGALYGTTANGGASGKGVVFKVVP